MHTKTRGFIILCFLVLWFSTPLYALEGLKWDSDEPEIKVEKTENSFKATAILKGQLDLKDWSLIYNDEKIHLSPHSHLTAKGDIDWDEDLGGFFELQIPLAGRENQIELTAVGPLGEIETVKVLIPFPGWNPLENPEENAFSTGMDFTSLSYKQSAKSDFSIQALTLKTGYFKPVFSGAFTVGGSVFVTLLGLSQNIADTSVRFLGVNFRMGYNFPQIPSPWGVSLLFGGYYSTMFVTKNKFGYSNLYGPQIYPAIKRKFAKGDALSAYLKLSPITDGVSILSLSTRELAMGVAWSFKLKGGHLLSLDLNFADLALSLSGSTASSSLWAIGSTYYW